MHKASLYSYGVGALQRAGDGESEGDGGGGAMAVAARGEREGEDFLARVSAFIQIHLLVLGGYTTRD